MWGPVKSVKEMAMAIGHLFLKDRNYQNGLLAAFSRTLPCMFNNCMREGVSQAWLNG